MDSKKLLEIKELIDEALNAPTKQDAQQAIRKLEFINSTLKGELNGYERKCLSKVVISTKNASGQVQDKESKIIQTKEALHFFESIVTKHSKHL